MNEPWLSLLVQIKKRYSALNETYDLTRQMGEALDRNDQTSFAMLLAMRQEPILRLQELDGNIRRVCEGYAPDMRQRWEQLTQGASPLDESEAQLAEQLARNKRLIERLVPMDQRIQQVLSAKKA